MLLRPSFLPSSLGGIIESDLERQSGGRRRKKKERTEMSVGLKGDCAAMQCAHARSAAAAIAAVHAAIIIVRWNS